MWLKPSRDECPAVTPRVLLVDDEPPAIAPLRRDNEGLRLLGRHRRRSDQAISMLVEDTMEKIDIAILDYNIPVRAVVRLRTILGPSCTPAQSIFRKGK